MSDSVPEDAARPHEKRDASSRGIAVTAAAVAALILAGLGTAASLWSGRPALRRAGAAESFRHGPADVPDVVREWPAIERENREHLETYGWVDRRAGVVRIPIGQAMRRIAANTRMP